MSQNSKSKRLWECSEPMTHGILTELKSFFWQLLSQYCECFQYVPNQYLRSLCHDFFKVASIKPEVSEFFRCLLISLRLSDSDKNFLTLRMTVVLLFFFLGFFLCSSLTMCLFRLKAELNVLEHSLHRCLSATLTFFSLTKVPKPAADFTFFTWFSLCDDLFSWVFNVYHIHTLIYVSFHIYHNSKIFSPCQASVRAPASYVCWHLTWLHFRKGIFHICAFSGF